QNPPGPRYAVVNPRIEAVAAARAGKLLAIGRANDVLLHDAETGAQVASCQGHEGNVTCVAFSADGKRVASGSADKSVKIWNAATGKELQTLTGHSVALTSVAFAPDGALLATGAGHRTMERRVGEVKLWDASTGKLVADLQGHKDGVTCVALAPDG